MPSSVPYGAFTRSQDLALLIPQFNLEINHIITAM
eukprot:COSAG01_NODE_910_length_12784_cov_15.136460_6_plen_35_part_00